MVRKKRAWGPSNPLWRWQHGKGSSRPSRPRRRSGNMARRRYGRRRGGGGIGSLTPALYGAGAAFIAPRLGLNLSPLIAGAAGGFLARKNVMGAVMGAAGAYGASMLLGNGSTGTSGGVSGAW